MAKPIAKADRPEKICPICKRPFGWRKKWARTWSEVRYCSERCRRDSKTGRDPAETTSA